MVPPLSSPISGYQGCWVMDLDNISILPGEIRLSLPVDRFLWSPVRVKS